MLKILAFLGCLAVALFAIIYIVSAISILLGRDMDGY